MKSRTTEKRKTYSISFSKASILAKKTNEISDYVGDTVPKQDVLDMLVGLLETKYVYDEVLELIKNKKKK